MGNEKCAKSGHCWHDPEEDGHWKCCLCNIKVEGDAGEEPYEFEGIDESKLTPKPKSMLELYGIEVERTETPGGKDV